jgi:hypothetical protein
MRTEAHLLQFVWLLVVFVLAALPAECWSDGEVVPLTIALRHRDRLYPPRPMPHALSPRFGVDRVVILHPSHVEGLQAAQDDSKIQIELGRALRKKTVWMPLRTSDKQNPFAKTTRFGRHLAEVHFKFGFERHIFGRLTEFKYSTVYSHNNNATTTGDKDTLRIRYTWHATHDYDTHMALTATYTLCSVVFVVLLYIVSASSGTGNLRLIVRDRAE